MMDRIVQVWTGGPMGALARVRASLLFLYVVYCTVQAGLIPLSLDWQ